MNRVATWLLGGVTAWLALKTLRDVQPVPLARAGGDAELAGAPRQAQGRGRTAARPSDIPAPGWKDILLRTYKSMSEDRLFALAAGVTYYVLLALFPGMAALVSIYGMIADPADIGHRLDALSGTIPQSAIDLMRGQLQHLASQNEQALGLAFIGGVLGSLWGANAAVKALFDALNVVYGEREKRNFLKLNALSLFFTACFVLFLVLAMTGIVAVPAVLDLLHLGSMSELIINLLRWPALLLLVILGLALVYRYGPSRADARWRWVSWGSAAAAFLWLGVSMLFSWYAGNFGSYDKTYGSLGAVAAFMVWTWLSMTVVLTGGELNAEIEHQTARDSTTGRPKPMGARGARMADTLGAAQD